MKNEKPLISIIVPIYKTEQYMRKCINSIINQTYENIEIILINDGSPDGCPQICDEYKKIDSRITVIHQSNKGQGCARNKGLDYAKGEYVGFVDSDDWILPQMYEKLYNMCIENKADIAICEMYENEVDEDNNDEEIRLLAKDNFMHDILLDVIGSQPCNKLYKAELFKGLRFPEGKIAEDILLLHHVFENANTVVVSNIKLYVYYCKRADNTSNIKGNIIYNSYYRGIAFRDRYTIATKKYPIISQHLLAKSVMFLLGSYMLMIDYEDKYITEITYIKNFFYEYKNLIFKSEYINIERKVTIYLIIINPKIIRTMKKMRSIIKKYERK